EVVEVTINQEVADADLEIRFPPGCKVHDNERRKEYLVQADGSLLELNPPAEEPGFLDRHRVPIFACLALLFLLLACLAFGVALRRRRGRPPADGISNLGSGPTPAGGRP